MISPRAALLIVAGVVGAVALASFPASSGAEQYDVTVAANAQWHSTLRYWDVDALNIVGETPSRVVNFKAWFENGLFFGGAPERDIVFLLVSADGTFSRQIIQETPSDGITNFGRLGEVQVIFTKVPPGTYTLSVRIPSESHALYDHETKTVAVGASA